MATFFAALVFFSLIIAAMAVGVLFGKAPIKGSCGGLNNIGLDGECEICGGSLEKCEDNQRSGKADPGLAYDASKR
ncbi:MAG: (Na+)-NQR maturation NqrM [Pseudomonadota bacterium]|nr:ApbE family protein [Pseudomonadales bacterium]MDY6921674.1 (Na+)-NQR maturation NqrM [Pseudomonadota bacterium]